MTEAAKQVRTRPLMLQHRLSAEEIAMLDRLATYYHLGRAQMVRLLIAEEARRLGLAATQEVAE